MPSRKLSIEAVTRLIREMYGDLAMMRYKTDGQGHVVACSIGMTDQQGTTYYIKGMSDQGDWQACVNMAKKLARDQSYQTIRL